MFLAVAGLLASALSSANNADAQRRYAKAVKNASAEDLPPAWKSALSDITAQSQQEQAAFEKSLADQQRQLQLIAIVGGALLLTYLVLR